MARSDSYQELIESRLDEIESWVEYGETDKDIAEKLGVGYSTYRKYKTDSVALKGAIATGKDKANQSVEKALLNNCLGYKYTEEVATKVKEEVLADDGKTILVQEKVVVKPVKKYSKPDLAAQKFWLVNRKSKMWSEDPNKVLNDKKLTKLKEKEANSKIIGL
ncbi:transcriptional regulator with XRE-family HTH domain [Clostridium beijerinckii]|uniref:Xaa-His dipeptidase n=1 Tax=Clostridium beijerinckii TaxID=1520 RepID=UPI0014942C98|nr:Xaa-His dipeptidase [Clostridium beijerinckii]NOW93098.1 transcriptional regulator with XRE-family HTH domain [Clostridium beijerinckii]NRT33243.1 transcriptional regulator with XRE-family HTH domain [Clostridium beijerinckii]NRT47331.1 transcriptional regulator with XRE-family HTH domain [Clostridium beijerinckii]NRZ18664.1 transcriptional regulator with XRE-family HTH domain [Clostridium beijerinckii]